MQVVVALVIIWILFAVLSWILHAVKWMLVVAIIASVLTVLAKYLRRPNVRQK
jgi:multisubunit Na+/H+ antiporter MnhF subunit